MFSLKKFFGGKAGSEAPETASPAPDANPPLRSEVSRFLRRDPVFDRQSRLTAHLFSLQKSSLLADAPGETQYQIDSRLLAILGASPDAWNTQFAFLPLGSSALDLPAVDRLPCRNLGLLIQLDSSSTDEAGLVIRLATLRERGLKIGIFRQPRHPLYAAAALQADLGIIDVGGNEAGTVRDFSAALRANQPDHAIQLLALNIATLDEFRLCQQWHFTFFHGAFAGQVHLRPESPQADPHKVQLLHLLHLVQGDAETAEIAEAMKQDPLLTFRILRYLNSPALGLSHRIDSIGQALIILGRQRLTRWISVLLFSVREPNFADWMLVESALTRGRLMEELGETLMPGQACDALFLTGIFSCLGRLLHRPLAEIIVDLPIAESIRQALLERQGPFAGLLAIAEACETYDHEQIQQTAHAAGVAPEIINHALLAATAWASEVTEHWE